MMTETMTQSVQGISYSFGTAVEIILG